MKLPYNCDLAPLAQNLLKTHLRLRTCVMLQLARWCHMGTSMWRNICAVCPVVRTLSLDASRIDYHTVLYKEYTSVDKESCGESTR